MCSSVTVPPPLVPATMMPRSSALLMSIARLYIPVVVSSLREGNFENRLAGNRVRSRMVQTMAYGSKRLASLSSSNSVVS